MSTTQNQQAPRTAWINAMRAEVLRVGKRIPEVARVVQIGVWIATYADADGSNAFPGRDTLACLAGCSEETVTLAVRVLTSVGALQRRRRPNASSMFQLVPIVFLPGGLPWEEHIHHMTETRQRKAHAKKKAEAVAEVARKASVDAVREGTGDVADSVHGCAPESVRGGGSETAVTDPDSVHGRPRTASTDGFRTASVADVYKVPPTSGRDPRTDKDGVADSPQPQDRACSRGENESSQERDETRAASQPGDAEGAASLRLCQCGQPLLRAHRDECSLCIRNAQEAAQRPVQGAFVISLADGGQGIPQARRERVQWPVEDPAAPLRVCGCGRKFRLADSERCPGCVYAAEEEGATRKVASSG